MIGEVDVDFFLHFDFKYHGEEKKDLRKLFKTLLKKSVEIANPL